MSKTRQQEAQEKRLQRNVKQAQRARAETKKADRKTAASHAKPSKKGGFFAGLRADAPQTVQQSIPYKEMYRDGICRLNSSFYTKTVQFFDINYQLAQADDKAQYHRGQLLQNQPLPRRLRADVPPSCQAYLPQW